MEYGKCVERNGDEDDRRGGRRFCPEKCGEDLRRGGNFDRVHESMKEKTRPKGLMVLGREET